MSLLWVAIAGLSPDFLRSVLEQQQPELLDDGLSLEQVRDTVLAFAGAFIVWCVVALVLAGFAMARRDWARRGLMVIAAFSAGRLPVLRARQPARRPAGDGRRGDRHVPAPRRGAALVRARAALTLASSRSATRRRPPA